MIFCAENARRYVVYDFGFRGYYAAIGRFTSIDPLAEGTYYQGCYNYANGNPVANIDFMGLFGSSGIGTTEPTFPTGKPDDGFGGGFDDFGSWKDLLDKLMGKGQGSLGGMLGGGGRLPNNFGAIFEGFLNGTVSGDVIDGIMMNYLFGSNSIFDIPVLWHDPPENQQSEKKSFVEKVAEKGAKIGTRILKWGKVISKQTAKKANIVLSIPGYVETYQETIEPAFGFNESLEREANEQDRAEAADGEKLKQTISNTVTNFLQSIKDVFGIGNNPTINYDQHNNIYYDSNGNIYTP